jgi:hypothetical protein
MSTFTYVFPRLVNPSQLFPINTYLGSQMGLLNAPTRQLHDHAYTTGEDSPPVDGPVGTVQDTTLFDSSMYPHR